MRAENSLLLIHLTHSLTKCQNDLKIQLLYFDVELFPWKKKFLICLWINYQSSDLCSSYFYCLLSTFYLYNPFLYVCMKSNSFQRLPAHWLDSDQQNKPLPKKKKKASSLSISFHIAEYKEWLQWKRCFVCAKPLLLSHASHWREEQPAMQSQSLKMCNKASPAFEWNMLLLPVWEKKKPTAAVYLSRSEKQLWTPVDVRVKHSLPGTAGTAPSSGLISHCNWLVCFSWSCVFL